MSAVWLIKRDPSSSGGVGMYSVAHFLCSLLEARS